MTTGAAEMPATSKGNFREEYCPSHIQVEWDVSYEALQKCGDALRSPVFRIGRQSYMLESQCNAYQIVLSLLRMGPCISKYSVGGQFWGALKRANGDCDHRYTSGAPNLHCERRSFEKEASLGDTIKSYAESMCLTQDGCLKFLFRMNIETPLVGLVTCKHGTPQMPNPEAGSIRQEECSRHQQVEWKIIHGIQKGLMGNSTSPVFKIGTQMYCFELCVEFYIVKFHLYRVGRSVNGPAADVRYWIGLKCRDGTYNHRNDSGKLSLVEEFSLWTIVATKWFYLPDLEKHYLTDYSRHSFFLRMNVDSPAAELCSHGTSDEIAPEATGNIREEQCSSHKQVEWEIDYKVPQGLDIRLTSPVFNIATQAYFFEACIDDYGDVSVTLFRLGPSVRGPTATPRYWVGLKGSDGTYKYEISSPQLNLWEDLELWTEVDHLLDIDISASGVKEKYLTSDSRLTFVFRMNTKPTGKEMCTHGTVEMPSSVTGRIQEIGCSSHREVEWDVDYVPLEEKLNLTSPAFKIDTQMYCLGFFEDSFLLYRLGRSVDGPASYVRFWAGLKHPDGTYPFRNFSEIFDLHDDFELWTLATDTKDLPELDKDALKYTKRLTIFFRMNVESKVTEECIHGPIGRYAPSGEGSIQIQACRAHNHVLWDVAYEASQKNACSTRSPVFKVGNQWYHLNVCYDSENPVTVELYRSGYPIQGPASCVGWWAGLKSGCGSYHHHMQTEDVDFREEFSLPTHVASFAFPSRSDLERTHVTPDGRLKFFFQLNVPQATIDEATCTHGAEEMCAPGDGSIREIKDNLVEWDVGYEEPREHTHFSTSPVFKMGIQCYLLELCYEMDGILALSLYRFGRSVEGTVRCWAGLKLDRGMYHHNIEGVEFELRRDCELWTKQKVLGYFRRCDLENQCLTKNGRLTFFCLISEDARESNYGAVQTDGNTKGGDEDRLSLHSEDGAVQTDGNTKGGDEDRLSLHSEDFKKLREDFRLWLEHPEEGDRIRRRRREEFETKRWKVLEKQLKKDKEPSIFAA